MDLYKAYEILIIILKREIYKNKKIDEDGQNKLNQRIFALLTDQLRILNQDSIPDKNE